MATHNRARRLEAMLASLREQTLGHDAFEVVVVDDASDDEGETRAALDAAVGRGDLDLRVIHRERSRGPAVARNEGWRAARAPLVAFTDDDCRAAPEWLESALVVAD